MFRIRLNSLEYVNVIAFHCVDTYAGLFEGTSNKADNLEIVEETIYPQN